MSRCVVERSASPANSWMALAGAPFIARCDLSAGAAQPRRRNRRVPQDVHALFDPLIASAYPAIDPTMADSLTGPDTLTVVPSAFRSTTLVKVTVARRDDGIARPDARRRQLD